MTARARGWRVIPLAAGLAGLMLAACAPTAPAAPTTAPAKPTVAAPSAAVSSPAAKAPVAPAASPSVAPATSSPSTKPSPSSSPGPAAPDEKAAADFYAGKTVRLIVGYGAGGGYDLYARLIARHLSRYIPGNPTVIVENMPGAGSKLAFSQIYNALPKDGTVIGHGDGTFALTYLTNPSDFDFNPTKWQYLGVPLVLENRLIATKSSLDKSGVSKFQDLVGPSGKQLVIGTPGDAQTGVFVNFLTDVLGANLKVITGYAGTSAIKLALENGEVDSTANWNIGLQPDIDSGALKLLMVIRNPARPGDPFPGVPDGLELARTPEDRDLIRAGIVQPQQFARPFVMAPGVPSDRVQVMRAAFSKVLADKELLADAAKAKQDITPIDGEELQRIVTEFATIPDALKAKLSAVVNKSPG